MPKDWINILYSCSLKEGFFYSEGNAETVIYLLCYSFEFYR